MCLIGDFLFAPLSCLLQLCLFVFDTHHHTSSPCMYAYRVQDNDTRLMLWDTAGQEEFDAITKAYYRGILKLDDDKMILL